MSFSQTSASPCWFPNSILLCGLLLSSPRKWWFLLLATLPIRLLVAVPPNTPLWFLLICFLIDSFNVILVAAALRLCIPNPVRFATVGQYGLFCLFAVILGPAISAFSGGAARHALGYSYWPAWLQWFLGNATTQLIVTPAIFFGVLGDWRGEWHSVFKRWKEGSLLLGGLLLAGYVAFSEKPDGIAFSESSFYAPIPFLFWAAIRFGMFGAAGSILIIGLFAVSAALEGRVYFFGQSPADNAAALQHFLLIRAAPLYLVSILVEQKNRIENSLRESEKRFRFIADSAPVLIWMSGPDKLCHFFNKAWLDFTGRTLEQEQGDGWAQGVHPEDLERCLHIYLTCFDAHEHFEMEYRLRRHDGEYRWILDHGSPRYSAEGNFAGYVGSAIDITERRKQETALRNSEERYREVLENQTDLVCRYLPDTTLTFVNEAYCRFFKRRREELLGKKFLELLPEKTRALTIDQISMVGLQKQHYSWEHEVLLPGGGLGWQHWVNHPICGTDGEIEEFQAIGHDITDRKRAEELSRLLIHAQEEERKRIARELHDDFNQRLAALAIALSNLEEDISRGHKNTFALQKTVGKLQGEAMILAEEIRLIAHELHPPSIEHDGLEKSLRAFCREFSSLTNLHVEFSFENRSAQIPSNVTICCFRVVQEGLRNVAKHARATEAIVKVVAEKERVSLTLADNGVGVEPSNGNPERGLGLSSMKERVELLSGDFRIANCEPQGTLVMVSLPV